MNLPKNRRKRHIRPNRTYLQGSSNTLSIQQFVLPPVSRMLNQLKERIHRLPLHFHHSQSSQSGNFFVWLVMPFRCRSLDYKACSSRERPNFSHSKASLWSKYQGSHQSQYPRSTDGLAYPHQQL